MEVFLQGEGLKDIVLVQVPRDGNVGDLIEAAKERGLLLGDDKTPSLVFIEEGEDELNLNESLKESGIRHRSHIHIHRCRKIKVLVNFNGQQESREFPPSATVGRVKKWAVKVFNMSDVDATEHVLQITGSDERPDEDIHIGTLVTCPNDQLSFDLVPKIRVEG